MNQSTFEKIDFSRVNDTSKSVANPFFDRKKQTIKEEMIVEDFVDDEVQIVENAS